MQSRNRDTGIENKPMDTKQERRGGMNCKIEIDTYTLFIPCVKEVPDDSLLYRGNSQCFVVT